MNNKQKKHFVRMEDIAKAAGVSKSAVSKALNNKPDISENMRAHIFKICEDMNYQINFRIQDMIRERQTGMTHNIAFITVRINFSNPAYSRLIDGIAKGADENNLRLLLEQLSGDEKSLYDLPPILRDARVDGFIVTGSLNNDIMSALRKLDIPYIVIGTYDIDIIKNSINLRPDIESGLQKIVDILKNARKKNIAFFYEDPDNFFEKRLLNQFKLALNSHNIEFNKKLIYRGSGRYTGAFDLMKEIFNKKSLPFDSLVCLDFRTAQEISHLAFAHSQKYSVPPITLATSSQFKHYNLPIPVIYYDNHLSDIAFEAVASLVNVITSKNKIQTKKILISPDIYYLK